MTDQMESKTESAEDTELSAALMAIWGNPEMSSNPQPMHARLRKGGATLRVGPMVMLNTRAAVEEALSKPEVFSSQMSSSRLGNTRPLIPMQIDPPDHRKYRKLLDPLFSNRQIGWLESEITDMVGGLIDTFIHDGTCDYTEAFATPIASLVMLRLLGLPAGDVAELARMKDGIVHPPRRNPAETEGVQRAAGQELYRYFQAAVEAKRHHPDEGLVSVLLTSDVDGRPLTSDEIVDICYLLILAGLDTVADALTLSTVYLARNPDARQLLIADPSRIPAAIEELLRWESPVPGVSRLVTADSTVAGCPVKPGDLVFIGYGAANTDPEPLPDATTVRFDRDQNRHVAFGTGIHRCLGAQLARLELRVALTVWHHRIPDYEISAGSALTYAPGLRSVLNLPLTFSPTAT